MGIPLWTTPDASVSACIALGSTVCQDREKWIGQCMACCAGAALCLCVYMCVGEDFSPLLEVILLPSLVQNLWNIYITGQMMILLWCQDVLWIITLKSPSPIQYLTIWWWSKCPKCELTTIPFEFSLDLTYIASYSICVLLKPLNDCNHYKRS